MRNILQRKCCFVHNKCSDRNVTECENAKEIQGLLKRLQGSHSTWKTWKMRVHLENLEKWGYTRKTWKNYGILSFQKSGNPEDYLHNIQWSWYYSLSFDINFFSKSFFNFFHYLDTVKISAWTCSTNRKYFFPFFLPLFLSKNLSTNYSDHLWL